MPPARVPAIIVHGGAGADPAEGRDELRAGVGAAVLEGWRVLKDGGGALDAVEAARARTVILLDWRGRIGYAHSTPLMPVAIMSPTLGEPRIPF
jgi:isoaspartyl peptidase/L-asparaginase-like protein (Ntn-hydrolase superfamily)